MKYNGIVHRTYCCAHGGPSSTLLNDFVYVLTKKAQISSELILYLWIDAADSITFTIQMHWVNYDVQYLGR